MTARIMLPLLAMTLVVAACQTSTVEPEGHSPTWPIEDTTLPPTTTEPTSEVATTVAAPQRLYPVRVGCSTALPAFPCSALIDGSLETDWQAPDGGISARITFAFDHPYKITEIGFANIPDDTRFLRNGRIKDVEFLPDDLLQQTYISLDDNNAATQWIAIRSLRTSVVTVTVTSAYPGVSVGESPPFAELALAEVMFRGTEIGPEVEPEAANSTSATTPLADEVVVDPPTGAWQQTNPDLGGLLVDTRDMIWDGENFYLLTRIGFGDVIVWQSSDGIEWMRHSQIGTAGTLDGPNELVSVGGLLIAAGWRGSTATVWVDEGEPGWAEIEVGPGTIDELVYFKGKYIALGRAFYQPEPGQTVGDNNTMMWSSPDGYIWTRAIEEEFYQSAGDFTRGLVEGPAGLLTVGFDFGQAESEVSAVLTSTDGVEWVSHQPTGLDLTQIDDIAGSTTAYITFGLHSQILRSPDGITWEAIAGPDASDDEYMSWNSLATLGDLIVLSGSTYRDNRSRPGVWVYRGGGLWAVLGTGDWYNGPGVAADMVSGNGRLVVRAEAGPSGDDWAIFTFVADPSD